MRAATKIQVIPCPCSKVAQPHVKVWDARHGEFLLQCNKCHAQRPLINYVVKKVVPVKPFSRTAHIMEKDAKDLLSIFKHHGKATAQKHFQLIIEQEKLTIGESSALANKFAELKKADYDAGLKMAVEKDARKQNPVSFSNDANIINDALALYGARLGALHVGEWAIIKGNKTFNVNIKFKRNKMLIDSRKGALLFIGAITGAAISNFVESFWHWEKLRKENPVPLSKSAQFKKAAKLYENFTGYDAVDHIKIDKPDFPDIMCVIGDVDEIFYTTDRDGGIEKYRHKFANNSRPLFCVSPDGKQIFLLGGAFEFTERGIVDRVKGN